MIYCLAVIYFDAWFSRDHYEIMISIDIDQRLNVLKLEIILDWDLKEIIINIRAHFFFADKITFESVDSSYSREYHDLPTKCLSLVRKRRRGFEIEFDFTRGVLLSNSLQSIAVQIQRKLSDVGTTWNAKAEEIFPISWFAFDSMSSVSIFLQFSCIQKILDRQIWNHSSYS